MNYKALEIYLYMGSHDKVIEEFEANGINTEVAATAALRGMVQSNMISVLGSGSGSLAGTANGTNKIIEHFKKKDLEKSA